MSPAAEPIALPTLQERAAAADAARALRERWNKPDLMGKDTSAIILMGRPRRSVVFRSWANLPGFRRVGRGYTHALLPGWEYLSWEVEAEMIPDLERLAATGQRPEGPTR